MRLAALSDDGLRLIGSGDTEIRGLSADSRAVAPGRPVRRPGRSTRPMAAASSPMRGRRCRGGAGRRRGRPRRPRCPPRSPTSRALPWRSCRGPVLRRGSPHGGRRSPAPAARRSTAVFTRQLWAGLGLPAASIGTLGVQTSDAPGDGSLTTPDPITLHRTAAELAHEGVEHLVIEASSHGLRPASRRRAAPSPRPRSPTSAATISTITAARPPTTRPSAGCSRELLPPGAAAMLNADVPEFADLAGLAVDRRHRVAGLRREGTRGCGCVRQRAHRRGPGAGGRAAGPPARLRGPLVGGFQAHNLLAAAGPRARHRRRARRRAAAARRALRAPPGRMQLVARHPAGAPAFVDYAHKPEALAKALEALRPHTDRPAGRRVRLRRRPRCRQAAADGRDRGPAGRRGDRHRRQSAQRGPGRDPPRHPGGGSRRASRSATGRRRSGPPSPASAPATRCSSPARATRTTRSSATATLPFDDAEVLRAAARPRAGGR